MKIVALIGTDQKGCTYHMYLQLKQYMQTLATETLEFVEYPLPSSAPHFCIGCKSCFNHGEDTCPHHTTIMPIWEEVLQAQLLIFIYPMYVMRVPGALKALLDHWGVHWLSHRPAPEMFVKKALVITQGIGAPYKGALKDVTNALTWMGVSDIHSAGFRLMEGVVWDQLSITRREKFSKKLYGLAVKALQPVRKRRNLKVRVFFAMCQSLQSKLYKKDPQNLFLDTKYWLQQGWIKRL